MFLEHFGFSSEPFKLTPDPRFFYGSKSHNKAMAYLHYGLRQGDGFIVVTGEIGAGKSMLITHLLDQVDRTNIIAADLITPNLQPNELLSHILSAFRIEPAADGPTAEIEAFEDFLFDQLNRGRRVLLIVDEAQNLPKETLEELRVLSNLDYDGTPLFQVFLIGQPDFKPIIGADGMEQLRQRIIASYHLEPLSEEDVESYIKHRLGVVGWNNNPRIENDAYSVVLEAT
ncbi:MAG: AAA family ATPase, partial [Pseudomonadota bacterium]